MLQKTVLAGALALALGQTVVAQNDQTTTDMPATKHQQNTLETIDTTDSNQTTSNSTATETADMASMEYDVRASDLLGAEIENVQDEDLGEIDDLTITGKDKVLHAVISVGGFLGVGDKRIAVPYERLDITREADDGEIDVVFNATKEELENMPAFSYRDGDMSWRERMQDRLGEWTDKAKGAVENMTGDETPDPADTTTNQ